jgi:hypothetical protein
MGIPQHGCNKDESQSLRRHLRRHMFLHYGNTAQYGGNGATSKIFDLKRGSLALVSN